MPSGAWSCLEEPDTVPWPSNSIDMEAAGGIIQYLDDITGASTLDVELPTFGRTCQIILPAFWSKPSKTWCCLEQSVFPLFDENCEKPIATIMFCP